MPPKAARLPVSSGKLASQVFILDNGADTMKAGFASSSPDTSVQCSIIPNCVARGYDARHHPKYYVADQLDSCRDFEQMGFRRPVEKGFLVNWDTEMDIWKQAFFSSGSKLNVRPMETTLVLTEAPNSPLALQSHTDQMVFEEFEFHSYSRIMSPVLSTYKNDISALFGHKDASKAPEAMIVIDSGYSHTTITPVLRNRPLRSSMRRLDIGGKFLTAALAELISVRHYDLRAEPYQINNIKEAVSFVSQDFKRDLERTWKGASPSLKSSAQDENMTLEYVLPDWHHTFIGTIRPYDPKTNLAKKLADRKLDPLAREKYAKLEDSFPLCNERFVVPELLFNPGDIGMIEAGLPEAVVQVLATLPSSMWPAMLGNVFVTGGTSKIPGFVERLQTELRALTPGEIPLVVRRAEDPITSAWEGGISLAKDPEMLKGLVITKQEYEEHGAGWTTRKMNGTAVK